MMKHTLEMRNDYLRLVFPDQPTSLLALTTYLWAEYPVW